MMDINATDQSLAHRRGMILGLTLAEVMLIVLFCILMLFSILTKQEGSVNRNTPEGELRAENTRLRRLLSNAERRNQELSTEVEQQQEEIERLKADLEAALSQVIKPGDRPPCMFEPRFSDRGRPSQGPIFQRQNWRTVPLGIVYIEPNQLTLVHKNSQIPQIEPIDWLGDLFEYEEAYSLIEEWEEDSPLSSQEYLRKGAPFLRIGDNASPQYQCRFTMDFIMEDGTPLDMKRLVFEAPFFENNRVPYEDLDEYYQP